MEAFFSFLKKEEEKKNMHTSRTVFAIFRAAGCKINGRDVELSDFLPQPEVTEEQERNMAMMKIEAFAGLTRQVFGSKPVK